MTFRIQVGTVPRRWQVLQFKTGNDPIITVHKRKVERLYIPALHSVLPPATAAEVGGGSNLAD
jgi:hypothetical protein